MVDILPNIIKKCIRGNRDAQSRLYHLYAPVMFIVCQRYARSREDAEDILQEGFIKVFINLEQYRAEGSFEGWMRRIFINCALQKYRSQTSLHVITLDEEHEYFYFVDEQVTSDLGVKELISLIQLLPASCRMVFNLYVFEGLKHSEIARHLGISEGTSKSNLFDARKQLQKAVIRSRQVAKANTVSK